VALKLRRNCKTPIWGQIRLLFAILLCFCASCEKSSKTGDYQIGVDPSWYGFDTLKREKNVLAFSTDLLKAIGESQNLRLDLISVNWDALLPRLQKGQYQAILSNMHPYSFNLDTYDFSNLYLQNGPVLVISAKSNWTALSQLTGKEIAVVDGEQDELLLVKFPGVLIRHYDSIPQALSDIVAGVIDGALIELLTASAYIQDLYAEALKIATPPLNDDGLRLITLHNKATPLLNAFNEGLKELKSSGKYAELAQKWGLEAVN